MIRDLMYIELKTGYSDDGPAWIGYVQTSKSKKTIYFNDREYYGAAEPPVRCGVSHLSGLTEPLIVSYSA